MFGLFKSKEDKFRERIRKEFDNTIKEIEQKNKDMINDPMFGGLLVEGAIGTLYQSLKEDSMLWLLAEQLGLDYDKIIEEECRIAIKKYLK
ncbi:MAG: hypothetical protein K5860_00575 [Bacteroidales bacterium]|nr:hypothetical protein [Bacteroidales bacterium]